MTLTCRRLKRSTSSAVPVTRQYRISDDCKGTIYLSLSPLRFPPLPPPVSQTVLRAIHGTFITLYRERSGKTYNARLQFWWFTIEHIRWLDSVFDYSYRSIEKAHEMTGSTGFSMTIVFKYYKLFTLWFRQRRLLEVRHLFDERQ